MMRAASERLGGLPPGSDSAKIRAAGGGKRRDELPESVRRQCDEIWLSDVTPHTGFENFAGLEQALRTLPGAR